MRPLPHIATKKTAIRYITASLDLLVSGVDKNIPTCLHVCYQPLALVQGRPEGVRDGSVSWKTSHHKVLCGFKSKPFLLVVDSSTLVQVMTWHQTDDKPLQQPTMAQSTDACNDGFVQDCSNSSASAVELLQSCTEPSICVTRPQ